MAHQQHCGDGRKTWWWSVMCQAAKYYSTYIYTDIKCWTKQSHSRQWTTTHEIIVEMSTNATSTAVNRHQQPIAVWRRQRSTHRRRLECIHRTKNAGKAFHDIFSWSKKESKDRMRHYFSRLWQRSIRTHRCLQARKCGKELRPMMSEVWSDFLKKPIAVCKRNQFSDWFCLVVVNEEFTFVLLNSQKSVPLFLGWFWKWVMISQILHDDTNTMSHLDEWLILIFKSITNNCFCFFCDSVMEAIHYPKCVTVSNDASPNRHLEVSFWRSVFCFVIASQAFAFPL